MKRTATQLVVRNSEITERLAQIAAMSDDEQTPEVRSEAEALHNEMAELQPELRAAAEAQEREAEARLKGETEPVAPELRQLYERAKVADVIAAAQGDTIDGATAELQAELGLGHDMIPTGLIVPEVRTAGQTPAPADVGVNQQPIIPAVWPNMAADFLDVDRPSVPVGEARYTVLSTSLGVGAPDPGEDQDHTAGAFTPYTIEPGRIQGSFFVRREDLASLAGMEESLRANLSEAMMNHRDEEIVLDFLTGDGALVARSGDAAAEANFDAYRGLVYDAATIDGLYAYSGDGIRLLVNPATYNHAAAQYRSAEGDVSALDSLMRVSGGVRVSAHIPTAAASSDDQDVIAIKGSGRRNAVSPIWEGVQVIVDPYSQSKAGEIIITAVMLRGRLEILRAAGYQRRKVQTGDGMA